MARASALLSLSLMLMAILTTTAAYPFRHLQLEQRSLHRKTIGGIRKRSDTTVASLPGTERLRYQSSSGLSLPIAAPEQLRSNSPSLIDKREELNGSSMQAVELPFTVEQLQQKLEAFIQSLSDDLAAMFGSAPSFSPPATAASPPAAPTFTTDSSAAAAFSNTVPTTTTTTTTTISTTPPGSFSTVLPSPSPVLLATFVTALSAVTRTLTVQHSTSITAPQSSSTPTAVSSNRSQTYIFEPMAKDNVVVYYGQTTQTSAVPLTEVCADPSVDLVILAFVPDLFGPGGWPTLNMGPHCWAASAAQAEAGATGLIDCVSDGFATQVQQCQDSGKTVMLSLGGAQGYSDTAIPSDQDAEMLASQLWNLFLGGTEIPQTNAMRPFGNVVLDGIDIDNESDTTAHIAPLVSALRALFQSSAATKPYFLSAAPQCPRPDASIPLSSMQTSLDFVWVQFYNNPACNLASGTSFLDALSAWSSDLAANTADFVDTGNGVSSPRLYMGVPAWPGAGSGYVDANAFRSLLQNVNEVHANFGGVMFWDGAFGEQSAGTNGGNETFMQIAKDVLG